MSSVYKKQLASNNVNHEKLDAIKDLKRMHDLLLDRVEKLEQRPPPIDTHQCEVNQKDIETLESNLEHTMVLMNTKVCECIETNSEIRQELSTVSDKMSERIDLLTTELNVVDGKVEDLYEDMENYVANSTPRVQSNAISELESKINDFEKKVDGIEKKMEDSKPRVTLRSSSAERVRPSTVSKLNIKTK